MNRPFKPAPAADLGFSPVPGSAVTVPAREMSGLDFLDMVGLSSPEKRAERRRRDQQACMRAIARGDTYGWPPAFVSECKELMAEPDTGWSLAERSAFGMIGGKL